MTDVGLTGFPDDSFGDDMAKKQPIPKSGDAYDAELAAKKARRSVAKAIRALSDDPMQKKATPKKGAVKSYFGGEITSKVKAAHEKKLAEILAAAQFQPLHKLQHHYRAFVAFAGKQRKPYATGNEKIDTRFLAALGHAGEAGEIANTVKKLMFRVKVGARKLPKDWREKLVSELGDDLWYFMLVLIAFDITLDEVMIANMHKLVKRGR